MSCGHAAALHDARVLLDVHRPVPDRSESHFVPSSRTVVSPTQGPDLDMIQPSHDSHTVWLFTTSVWILQTKKTKTPLWTTQKPEVLSRGAEKGLDGHRRHLRPKRDVHLDGLVSNVSSPRIWQPSLSLESLECREAAETAESGRVRALEIVPTSRDVLLCSTRAHTSIR